MQKRLRIIFMGSPDFSGPSLYTLIDGPHDLVAVVSGTDKKRGRGSELTPTPVKLIALENNIPVIEADDMRDPELPQKLSALNPDLFVVVAFKILPDALLKIPKIGSVNVHASLLPKYRGAAPIHHAIMQGETETGCTIFMLDSGIDTGGIIKQVTVPIGINENTGKLYNRLKHAGSTILAEAVDELANGSATFTKQDDTKATPAPKIFDKHCRVEFNRPALVVHNHIRGLNPFPGAYTMLDGKKFKILLTHFYDDLPKAESPGRMYLKDGDVWIDCADTALVLSSVQLEGKRIMHSADFFRGYQGEMKIGF
jgi:methionyl-tRNA formyltransferase